MKDARGTELEVGQKVAYNLSGTVSVGYIVAITPGERRDTGHGWSRVTKQPLIKVKQAESEHISKVRNEVNLLVIFED